MCIPASERFEAEGGVSPSVPEVPACLQKPLADYFNAAVVYGRAQARRELDSNHSRVQEVFSVSAKFTDAAYAFRRAIKGAEVAVRAEERAKYDAMSVPQLVAQIKKVCGCDSVLVSIHQSA